MNVKLTTAVETYLADLRRVSASGGATGERSNYGPLASLLNAVGATLKPKVFCVGELADQGAGHPDFGLYAAKQVQKGQPREGQIPECSVVEVKPAGDDVWLTAEGDQVSRYWNRYRLVLVTNMRDFVLVGEDADGRPAKLETFRLAESAEDFRLRLEHPRVFAKEIGAGFGEYLSRALSHRAALTEPKDLAWLLASYARDGLARVEATDNTPLLTAVRDSLESALGVRFEDERGSRFFYSTLLCCTIRPTGRPTLEHSAWNGREYRYRAGRMAMLMARLRHLLHRRCEAANWPNCLILTRLCRALPKAHCARRPPPLPCLLSTTAVT